MAEQQNILDEEQTAEDGGPKPKPKLPGLEKKVSKPTLPGLGGEKKNLLETGTGVGLVGGEVGNSNRPLKSMAEIENDLLSFMTVPVADNVAKLKNNIQQGNAIDPALVDFVKTKDPVAYNDIVTNLIPKKFLADYKKETGQDYSAEGVKTLKASQRIKLGIAFPGDTEQATTELIQDDLEKNFPIKAPNIFEPWIKPIEEQVKWYNEIMTNPEKKAEYLLKRQKQEIEKEAKLTPYEDRYSTESMSIGDAGFVSDNPLPTLQERGKKVAELNTLRGKIDNLKKIAAITITPIEMDKLIKENNIQDINSQDAIDYLQTKEARQKLGLRVALKSDARLGAQLADIQTSLQESQNYKDISQNKLPTTIIPTDEDSNFRNLSESGDEKIQAQLRLKGFNDMVNYYQQTGNAEAVKKLLSKQSDVAVENGKAVSDELFARLSAARFKDNDNSTTIGTFDITDANMRKWATQAGFTPVEMAILEQHMIPDENSRTITSNLQTSGFVDNLLEAVGNTGVNMKNLFRSDAARTREILNENAGRKEDVGQYTPFLQELKQISEKEKTGNLTLAEQNRKELLLSNTNLLNWWQQFKSGTGDLTGQVIGLAASAKGLDKIFKLAAVAKATQAVTAIETVAPAVGEFEAASTGIANNISNSPTFLQNVAKYAQENKTLYASSYANAYDGYKKESLQLMPGPENEGKRLLYSNMMSGFEALSEKIFDDRKVLNALGKEIKPVVREIVEDIGNGSLDKAAAMGKLQNVLMGGDYKKFIGNFLKGSNQEGVEEGVVDLVGDISKAIVLDQNYDFVSSAGGAFKTYYTMVLNGGLVAGMAAKSDTRNNTFNKSSLYNMAASPVDYKNEVNRLLLSGEISQQEANSKSLIIDKAENAYQAMINDGIIDKTGKNDAKNATYLLHVVNESVNKLKAESSTDEIAKADFEKQAERSKNIREGIYTGKVNVDEFLNPVTEDAKTADNLDIEQIAPIVATETGAVNKTVQSAVIEIGGKTYEGKNHAEAILAAQADGQDISEVNRKEDGKFKLSDGTIIDRQEAKKQFGQDRSELIIPQDEAANQANKDYAKIKAAEVVNTLQGNENVPAFELNAMQADPEGALQGIADQALGFGRVNGERQPLDKSAPEPQLEAVTRKYGEDVVNKAIELYPAEAVEIKGTPEEITKPIELSTEIKPADAIIVDKPVKTKQDNTNDLIDRVRQYNNLRNNDTAKPGLLNQLKIDAKEAGLNISGKSNFIELKNDKGNRIQKRSYETNKTEAKDFDKKNYSEKTNSIVDLAVKNPDLVTGLHIEGFDGLAMIQKQKQNAIKDLQAGKVTNGAKAIYDAVEGMVNDGEIKAVDSNTGTGYDANAQISLEDYLSNFTEEIKPLTEEELTELNTELGAEAFNTVFDNIFDNVTNSENEQPTNEAGQVKETTQATTTGNNETNGSSEKTTPDEKIKGKQQRIEDFNKKADKVANSLIDFLTPKTIPKGVQKQGIGIEEIVKGATAAIKAAYAISQNVKEAVEAGVQYIKDNWRENEFGELPEQALREKLTDNLESETASDNSNNVDEDYLKNFTLPLVEKSAVNASLKTDLAAGYSNDVLEQDDMVDSLELDAAVNELSKLIAVAKNKFGESVIDYAKGLYNHFKNLKDDISKLGVMVQLKNDLDNERKLLDDRIQELKRVDPTNPEISNLVDEREQVIKQLRQVADYIDKQGAEASKKFNILRLTKRLRGVSVATRSKSSVVGKETEQKANDVEQILEEPIDNNIADNEESADVPVEFETKTKGMRKTASSDLVNKAKASVARMKDVKKKLANLGAAFNKIEEEAKKLC